jgi:hypothetical protein
MSRFPRSQNYPLSSPYGRKWAKIIDYHWEETWQIVADRDDRISHHRDFAVDF